MMKLLKITIMLVGILGSNLYGDNKSDLLDRDIKLAMVFFKIHSINSLSKNTDQDIVYNKYNKEIVAATQELSELLEIKPFKLELANKLENLKVTGSAEHHPYYQRCKKLYEFIDFGMRNVKQ